MINYANLYIVLLGIFFIVLGVAIGWYPNLLVFLVVSFFMFMGIVSLLFGFSIYSFYRKAVKMLSKFKID